MFLSFLLGLAAGYVAPIAEPHVKKAVEDVFDVDIAVEHSQYDMLTLLLLLGLVALVLGFLGTVWALPLLVGAFLGVFGKQFYAALTNKTIRTGERRD